MTLFIFIGSCISIAIISLFFQKHAWIPIALDLTGISLLFVSSIFLMKESRMALSAVDHEMDYTLQLFQDKFAAAPAKRAWWRRWIPAIPVLRKMHPMKGAS